MTSLHDLIVSRRSIRRYTDRPIPEDDVTLILQAGLMAPTSKNSRAWKFIAVDDRDTLLKLSECKPGTAHSVAKCPLAVVVAIDVTKSEAWIEDASVAASFMMLQAQDLGLGSCWIEIRDRYAADGTPSEEIVRDILGMPETITPVCILSIGYKDEERKPMNLDKLRWENVHINSWRAED